MTEQELHKLRASPAAFRAKLMIDAGVGLCRFNDVVEDWQRQDFLAMDRAWFRAVHGGDVAPKFNRAWLGRPRGHSKSTDLGIMASWALIASPRPLRGIAAAADREQAAILRDAVDILTRCNPWLLDFLEVQRNAVINPHTGSRLDILSSDAPSSYGLTPDFVIADEVTHWPKGDMWDSLVSSAAKRPNCLIICITNAGIHDTWQANVRQKISKGEGHDNWYFNELAGPLASWITEAALAEQKALLPGPAFERLWLNQWSSGGGDALTPETIDENFDPNAKPMSGKELDQQFVVGIDLGLKRDASAIVVLAVEPHRGGHIRLAYTKIYRPGDGVGGKVDLMRIENDLIEIDRKYRPRTYAFDPWQAELMAQRLELCLGNWRDSPYYSTGDLLRETPPTAENLREQAALTIQLFNDRRLKLYECPELRRDLMKLRVEEKSYGYRLTSPRDATGHGDTFSAFALALPHAYKLSGRNANYYCVR